MTATCKRAFTLIELLDKSANDIEGQLPNTRFGYWPFHFVTFRENLFMFIPSTGLFIRLIQYSVLFTVTITILYSSNPMSQSQKATPSSASSLPSSLFPLPFSPNPLITGKNITVPPLGVQQNVGSLPMNMILTPDGKYAISSDMGFRQSLWSIDTGTGVGVSSLAFPGGSLTDPGNPNAGKTANGLYYGLAIRANGDGSSTLYASQGGNASIVVVKVGRDGSLARSGVITLKPGDFAAGIALDKRGYLYVAINEFSLLTRDDRALTTPGAMAVIRVSDGMEVGRYQFKSGNPISATAGSMTSNFPFAVAAVAKGSKVYVSSQRDGAVYALNATDPADPKLVTKLATGSHPISLLLNRAQSLLYVANGQSDTISIVSTAANKIVRTISVRPAGAEILAGATPNGLAFSPDERTLYVTLGDMNAVAVVDARKRVVTGYIPTGWYPTAVAVTAGKKLLFCNAKGTQTRHPNPGYIFDGPDGDPGYGLMQLEGNVSTMPLPNAVGLAANTALVLDNNHVTATTSMPDNPLRGIGLAAGKIKHVIYIVKENRTYDQVLGDLTDTSGNPVGNGSPALTLFGKKITPNQHALALRFVTLDNFYDCGEASGDGWVWSTQAMANEYVIRNLPYNYSGRGRQYDFEGSNNGYLVGGHPARDPDGGILSQAFPAGAPTITDVAESSGGHIWDAALKAGLSFRNYGFFYSFGQERTNAPLLPDGYPSATGLQPAGHDLAGRSDWDFRRYDNDYPDSDAPQKYFAQTGDLNCLYAMKSFGKYNATSRFIEWNREFRMMLAKDPTGGSVPNFMTIRFHHDHTQGFSTGKHAPESEVADNDYAVGQLVDAVSHSAIWNSTAIFVIEDDAQDGADHVDSHRSTCFVISPYIKVNSVDHAFYNTDSVLKTMEQLLGLPPMCQYDTTANTILDFDSSPGNFAAYSAILPDKAIISKVTRADTPLHKRLAKLSAGMDFAHPDSADPRLLNEILWKSIKGDADPVPRILNHGLNRLKDDTD